MTTHNGRYVHSRDGEHGGGERGGNQPVSRRTQLLRAAADAQLSAAEEHELAAHLAAHPEDRAVIDFERKLRTGVARAWEPAAAPADLRERIAQSIARQPAPSLVTQESEPVGRPFRLPWRSLNDRTTPDTPHSETDAPDHRFRLKPTWPLLTALAAAAVLAFGLFLALPRASFDWPADRPVLVSFLVNHHNECEVHADRVAAEFNIRRADEAPEAFSRLLGTRAELGDLDRAGLIFLGGRKCAVPGGGQSVHVLLAAKHAPDSIASLFIQRDTGALPIEDGRMYTVLAPELAAEPAAPTARPHSAPSAAAPAPEILVWRRDGLLYFLVCNSAIVREASLLALQPPEPGGTL
jgi:anti-sigma factor RsiW